MVSEKAKADIETIQKINRKTILTGTINSKPVTVITTFYTPKP